MQRKETNSERPFVESEHSVTLFEGKSKHASTMMKPMHLLMSLLSQTHTPCCAPAGGEWEVAASWREICRNGNCSLQSHAAAMQAAFEFWCQVFQLDSCKVARTQY